MAIQVNIGFLADQHAKPSVVTQHTLQSKNSKIIRSQMKLRESDSAMETSSNTTRTKRPKIVAKSSQVFPSNYHLDEKQYAGVVTLGGESHYTAWFDSEDQERAEWALKHLEIALDYDSYPTMQEEGTGREGVKAMAERVRIMYERYTESGRDDPDHPMHGLFTGLRSQNEQVSNNNSE